MAKNRRVIRKVRSAGQLVIDEQFWPVMLAMFLLGGFLTGTVAAYFPWQGRAWWDSASTWVFVIPAATCVAIWVLRFLPSRMVRRALQISFVLCLLIHAILLVVSIEARIFGRMFEERARNRPQRPQRQLRVVNDYQPHQLEQHQRQQPDFTRPVETAVPEPQPEPVERQEQTRPEQQEVPPQPMPRPEQPRDIQANPIERQTASQTRPRQSDQASRLSRQTASVPPQPTQPINVPRTAAATAAPSTLEARSENLRQQPAETRANQAQVAIESAAASQPSSSISRRASERAPTAETRTAPTLPRQLAQPSAIPRADAQVSDAPSIARQTATSEIQPARTTTRQQETAAPRESNPVVRTETNIPTLETPNPRREQPLPSQPQIAQTPVPTHSRQTRPTNQPSGASTAETVADATAAARAPTVIEAPASTLNRAPAREAVAAATPSNASQPTPVTMPSASAVARRSTNDAPSTNNTAAIATPRVASAVTAPTRSTTADSPAAAQAAESPAASLSLGGGDNSVPRQMTLLSPAGAVATPSAPSSSPTSTSLATSGQRARSSAASTPDATSGSVNHLARSERVAAAATSTALSETPRHVTADMGAEQLQASPSRLAATQSLGGVAGVGQSPNLDRSPSTPGSPSTTASGAARRAEATQDTPAGPALAPSSQSLVRRSLVGGDQPTASVRATTDGVAQLAGTDQPANLNASAGASLTQQSSNAKSGEVTAAKGNVDVDLGPTRVADAGGFERASGGGQPEVAMDQATATPTLSRSGGTAAVPQTTTVADATSASIPTLDAPSQSELAANGAAMQRTDTPGSGTTASINVTDPNIGSVTDAVERLGSAIATRTEVVAEVPSIGVPAEGDEDEEERRRRLARAAGLAAPAGSLAGPQVEVPATEAVAMSETEPQENGNGGGVGRQMPTNAAEPTGGPSAVVAATTPTPGGDALGAPSLERVEATDGLAGPVVVGGGTAGVERMSPARDLPTNVVAETVTIAGSPASSGSPQGADLAAAGGTPSPTTTGALTRTPTSAVGAAAGPQVSDGPPQMGVDATAGLASRATTNGDAPAIGESTSSASRLARAGTPGVNTGAVVAETVDRPAMAGSVAAADADLPDPSLGAGGSITGRQSTAALPVNVDAMEGPGGLGDRLAMNVGVNSRLSSPDSVEVQTTPSRFLRQEVGGAPELNTSAIFAAEAFRSRTPGRMDAPRPAAGGPAGPQTEEAVELGLAFLARRQLSDGSWTLRSTTEPVQLASDTAATGLCLLAFQGAGYNHREFRYAAQVNAAVEYLIKNQKPNGDLFVPLDDISNRSVWLYSHGIAALALCEAYGMTQDPKLRDPAQRALDYIIAAQDPKGGGWRYQPGVESDTSVTGWMMMALKSGELAGLQVPRSTYDHIERWLTVAQASEAERHLYRYNPYAPNTATQRHGRQPTTTMTAVGLLMRLYSGWRRDHPAMMAGAEHLRQNLPAIGSVREPLRDTYYWYYGTQVMFHMGGAYWDEWNGQLHPLLINSQIKQGELSGSWSPYRPLPDRWAPQGGRLYVTTMNLLSLEVTYRHLPLYVDTSK